MTKSKKRILLFLAITVVLVLIGFFVVQRWATKELTNILDHKLPPNLHLQYQNLELSLLHGELKLQDVALEIHNKDSAFVSTKLNLDQIDLKGLSYWQILINKNLKLGTIKLAGPKVIYQPSLKAATKDSVAGSISEKKFPGKLNSFSLDHLEISDGQFTIMKKKGDSIGLSVTNLNITLNNIESNNDIIKNKIPLKFGQGTISAKDIYADIGPLVDIRIGSFNMKNKNLDLKEIALKTKYSKEELSKVITSQRAHLDLKIPELGFKEFDFGFHGDRFFTTISEISVIEADLQVYRDRRPPDDMRYKPLFGTMLQRLPIDLTITKTNVQDSKIAVELFMANASESGRIFFGDVNASVDNIANTYKPGNKTVIDVNSKFMGNAPVHLKWNFDATSKTDEFYIAGSVQNFNPADMDSFLKSGLKVEVDGHIDQIYFTATGDNNTAKGDMLMKYEDFNFTVMQKDKDETNKFLTAIGNIFVNDGTKADAEGFRHGKIDAVRKTNKLFFNYLWECVQSGIVTTLTGLGMKEGKFNRMLKKKIRENKKEDRKEEKEKKKEEKKEN